jgi:hypothetical protein
MTMMNLSPSRSIALLLSLILMVSAVGSWAQSSAMRDPTEPPPSAGLAGLAGGPIVAPPPGPLGGQPAAILVRNGKPYLVVGTRLYARGQMIGAARVERITETEVWLREGGVLRKLPQFAGIERRPASSMPVSAPCAKAPAGKANPSSASTACAAAPN